MLRRNLMIIVSIAIAALLGGSFICLAQSRIGGVDGYLGNVLGDEFSLFYLEDDLGSSISTYINDNEPPLLRNLEVSPSDPGPDDDVVIFAQISNNAENTRSETLDVELRYSTDDGQTWSVIDMSNESDDGKNWTATIPSIGKPGTLDYYFFAEDDSGNFYAEVPAVDHKWASNDDAGYLVSINDRNSVYRTVSDDLDMLSLSIGYDGELLYFRTVVEGEISGGTVTPFRVNIYSVGFFFDDSPGGMGPKPDYVLVHAQHAPFIGFPIIGLLDVNENLAEVFAAEARYYSRRNSLYTRIKESVFDKHDHEYIRLVFGTAVGTEANKLTVETKDISSFINLVPGGHSLIIE